MYISLVIWIWCIDLRLCFCFPFLSPYVFCVGCDWEMLTCNYLFLFFFFGLKICVLALYKVISTYVWKIIYYRRSFIFNCQIYIKKTISYIYFTFSFDVILIKDSYINGHFNNDFPWPLHLTKNFVFHFCVCVSIHILLDEKYFAAEYICKKERCIQLRVQRRL